MTKFTTCREQGSGEPLSKRPRMGHSLVTGLADLVSDTVTQVRAVVTPITQPQRVCWRNSSSVPKVSNNDVICHIERNGSGFEFPYSCSILIYKQIIKFPVPTSSI